MQSPNSTAVIPPFHLGNIEGDKMGPLNFYEGSLDYPPCSESVTWFVDIAVIPITNNLVRIYISLNYVRKLVRNFIH